MAPFLVKLSPSNLVVHFLSGGHVLTPSPFHFSSYSRATTNPSSHPMSAVLTFRSFEGSASALRSLFLEDIPNKEDLFLRRILQQLLRKLSLFHHIHIAVCQAQRRKCTREASPPGDEALGERTSKSHPLAHSGPSISIYLSNWIGQVLSTRFSEFGGLRWKWGGSGKTDFILLGWEKSSAVLWILLVEMKSLGKTASVGTVDSAGSRK